MTVRKILTKWWFHVIAFDTKSKTTIPNLSTSPMHGCVEIQIDIGYLPWRKIIERSGYSRLRARLVVCPRFILFRLFLRLRLERINSRVVIITAMIPVRAAKELKSRVNVEWIIYNFKRDIRMRFVGCCASHGDSEAVKRLPDARRLRSSVIDYATWMILIIRSYTSSKLKRVNWVDKREALDGADDRLLSIAISTCLQSQRAGANKEEKLWSIFFLIMRVVNWFT